MKSPEMKRLPMGMFCHNKDGRQHDYHMSFREYNGGNNKQYYNELSKSED